jgi:mevalonate kinase
LGEHAVNRGGRALATALDLRVRCAVRPRADGRVRLAVGTHAAETSLRELRAFAARVEAADGDVARLAEDFLAPARFVLPALLDRLGLDGLDASWSDGLPVGAGLGSGAAAHCALAVAAARAAGRTLDPAEVAALAWRGDVLAHGGIASALDASACAYGGVIAYSVEGGAEPVSCPVALPLVVADTGIVASTGAVNAGVRERLAARPGLHRLFDDLALLVDAAREALASGDLPALGRLMHLDQLVLEKLGVSTPEIERLVDAALGAGAHGAKLSGSGGGGIVVALVPPDRVAAVTAAMTAAGGRAHAASAAAAGARPEPDQETLSP